MNIDKRTLNMGNIKLRFIASILGIVGGIIAILGSAIYGNIIGTISLIVGIYGVYISKKTMKTAEKMEEDLKEAKIVAIDKKRFVENKQQYISFFEKKRNIISKNNVFSFNDCKDIIATIGDVEGYKTILSQQDIENVGLQKQKLKDLIGLKQQNGNDVLYTTDLISAITEVLNIIKKENMTYDGRTSRGLC